VEVAEIVTKITALFWDVGGVLGSNGWDREARAKAARTFDLDAAALEANHARLAPDFERGRLSLDQYLDAVVFGEPRAFAPGTFADFMMRQSRPRPATVAIARALAGRGRYLMATLNNESRELNEHRIRRFGLQPIFSAFLSSCYLDATKPGAEIFRRALAITHRSPDECVFIDDRAGNVDVARGLGMQAVQYKGPAALRGDLRRLGVR
jgi:putative hydrolase of the HAD superfamily